MVSDTVYISSQAGSIGSMPYLMPGSSTAKPGDVMMMDERRQWGPADAFGDRLFQTNGYQRFPGGFMMEWGLTSNSIPGYAYSSSGYSSYSGNNSLYVYFHRAFSNACLGVYGNGDEGFSYSSGFGTSTYYNTTFPSAGITFSNVSRYGFTVSNSTAVPMRCRWFAVGY